MTCDTKLIDKDGTVPPFTCDREGWHIFHEESSTNRSAIRLPGGRALISDPE